MPNWYRLSLLISVIILCDIPCGCILCEAYCTVEKVRCTFILPQDGKTKSSKKFKAITCPVNIKPLSQDGLAVYTIYQNTLCVAISVMISLVINKSCVGEHNALQCRHNERNGVSNHRPNDFCSTVYWGADQRTHQSSESLAFVRGIHRWPVTSPHKGPVTRKMFPFDDVIMIVRVPDIVHTSRKSLWRSPECITDMDF